jgi:SM-20-related protein
LLPEAAVPENPPTDLPDARRVILPPHVVLRDFLPADAAAALFDFALAHESRFAPSKVGYGEAGRVDPAKRVSAQLHKLGPLKDDLRARFAAVLPDLIATLKTPPFEPSWIEVELVSHGDGAFFGRHLDTGRDKDGIKALRILSGVYYFHARPKAFSGGALRLHELMPSGKDRHFVDIEPMHNSFVAFPSWMPHEVLPVSCPSRRFADSRFAVNCWFHRAA